MRSSGGERGHCGLRLLLLTVLAAGSAHAQLSNLGPSRLVNVIEVGGRDEQTDITIIFNCSMRFVTSMPASEGTEVSIQLVPLTDCRVSPFGQIPSEIPPLSGGSGVIASARVEPAAPGQVTLNIAFRKKERFVLAQGIDLLGLRLRLVDHAKAHGKITVAGTEPVSNYAINLDSQTKPFTPEQVEVAHQRLQAPVFVSEATVDGEKWYRLRAGPIDRRAEADRLLNRALADYPRAWLAIGDDAVTSDLSAQTAQVALPPVERIGTDPALPPEEQKKILAQARTALAAHDYPQAIALLTKLQRQPEFPDRARAQELLGLAYERSGQLAHAKAEYQEYLHRYPNGEAADRVSFRLRTLQAAESKARTGREVSPNPEAWDINGGFSQMFRYDGTSFNVSAPPATTTAPVSPQSVSDNALFTDLDLLARRRGASYDWLGRFSGGYDKNFTQGGTGDATRVSLASVEVLDRPLGLLARAGRQIANNDGILGTFDGLFMSWQFAPSWAVNAAAGYPVNLLNVSTQTNLRFESLALECTPPGKHWDGELFATTSTYEGLRDREAVGAQGRYLNARGNVVALVDYDTTFHSLNTASIIGTLQMPARWTLSFDAEHRNAPPITLENALIGQTVTDLRQLLQIFTPQEIYQLALDRTPVTTNYSLTATRPVGARFQWTGTVTANEIGSTPASGGVPAQAATGLLYNYQTQLYGSNLWTAGDFSVLTLTHGNTEIGRMDSANITTRFPVGGSWRLAPRFAVERVSGLASGGTETTYIPSALLDFQRGNKLLQFETGAELGSRQAFIPLATGQFVQTQNSTRYYVSVSYRITFGP